MLSWSTPGESKTRAGGIKVVWDLEEDLCSHKNPVDCFVMMRTMHTAIICLLPPSSGRP